MVMSTVSDLSLRASAVGLREQTGAVLAPRWGRAAGALSVLVRPAGIALLIVVTFVAGVLWDRQVRDRGLLVGEPDYSVWAIPATAADPEFSLGLRWMEHPGAELQVLNVAPLMSPNLAYEGAELLWGKSGGGAFRIGPGVEPVWRGARHPAGEPFRPAVGEPVDSILLAGKFRLLSGDRGAVNGVMVTYRAEQRVITEVVPVAAVVCRPSLCRSIKNGDGPSEAEVLHGFGLLERDVSYV